MLLTLFAAGFLLMHEPLAQAALTWNWQYSGAGISAAGTFTTDDAPDAERVLSNHRDRGHPQRGGDLGIAAGRHGGSRQRAVLRSTIS